MIPWFKLATLTLTFFIERPLNPFLQTILFNLLGTGNLLLPQQLEAFINIMSSPLAVCTSLILIVTFPMPIQLPFMILSLLLSLRNPASLNFPSREGNFFAAATASVRIVRPSVGPLGFECENFRMQHRRLQGVDALSHGMLKSLPGTSQRSKEGNVFVVIGKRLVEIVVQVLKGSVEGVDVGLNGS